MVRSPPQSVPSFVSRGAVRGLFVGATAAVLCWSGMMAWAGQQPASAPRPVSVRVAWGGGKARAWSGEIRLLTAGGEPVVADDVGWQTLCDAPDAAATAHARGGTIFIHEPSRRGGDGVEIELVRWRDRRVAVRLWPDGDQRLATSFEATVEDLLLEPRQQGLDRDGNRLTLKAAPGDGLRVAFVAAAGPPGEDHPATAVFQPGQVVRVTVDPLLPKRSSVVGSVELRLRLRAAPDADPLAAQTLTLAEAPAEEGVLEPRLQRYERVSADLVLPDHEGVFEIDMEAVERGGLRWSRPLATRTVQLVAVSDTPVAPPLDAGDGWKVIHEVDPGSPRLHERLRRLPAAGMAHVPMPALPMPSMSLPDIGMPNVPLPNVPLPNVPMPNVPLPKIPSVSAVSAMVPRLGGLLATGHSTVEAHPLGPMLRLPPARSPDEPSWEGIVIASAQPGLPHLVEVEYPLDQKAVVGVTVLEADAGGKMVEPRAGSGFDVQPAAPGLAGTVPTTLGRHAFVFWPTTRHPLLVVANPSPAAAAVFGRVRVSVGPSRPPAAVRAATGQPLTAAGGGRRVHGFLQTPDFARFGGPHRVAPGGRRPIADWRTFLSGGSHAAEWLVAQGAAGAMVVVYGEGAAIWPSRLTRNAARWDSGAVADAGLDPVRKDVLDMLCRIHARERLRLVPAVSFDAPLPALESLLAEGGAAAVGIACVGRDGRVKEVAGGGCCHYNVLDPRVQQAVEDLVRELAGRLRGAAAVDGVAVLVPHDGWMHLPGTAWGLDDVTFARFLAETGNVEPASGGERFARRAALVEGPLRPQWLAWRADGVARFHARLAAALAEQDGRFSLHVVPTTLFAAGELAARFRPALSDASADADVLLEIGLDPARLTADARIVFVSPHVHAAADSLLDRSVIDNANRSLAVARGVTAAARRGVIVVEQPRGLAVADIVPHGPFAGAAAALDRVPVHPLADGMSRARPLAESLVAADVEMVFDMGLLLGQVEPQHGRCLQAFAALPGGPLQLADTLAAPLVVRSRHDRGLTVVSVANAGPTACRASLSLGGPPPAVVDAVDGMRLPVEPAGGAAVPLRPWEVRTLVLEGAVAVQAARAEYDADVREAIRTRLADLNTRRGALETPRPLDVLDNPGFELAGPGGLAPAPGGGVGGWELVEASRGAVQFVAGVDGPGGRGIAFSSANGLSTLRSNPFPPPASGRVSVAVWLRIADGEPQPPLRLSLEGVQDGREYYRFAAVGGLAGGKPLSGGWSQFVLQVDDLPTDGLQSLRVRFDLLGPGRVQIDGVRVFDLAFDEGQRVQLTRRLAGLEQRLAADDLGACLVELDTHWPRFLSAFVTDDVVAASRPDAARGPTTGPTPAPAVERSGSVFDRVRRWWQ